MKDREGGCNLYCDHHPDRNTKTAVLVNLATKPTMKGKDRRRASSHHPTNPTNYVVKTVERIVYSMLMW